VVAEELVQGVVASFWWWLKNFIREWWLPSSGSRINNRRW